MVEPLSQRLPRPTRLASPIFAVRAVGDLQALMRIANVFARRGVVPQQLTARTDGPLMLIEVQLVPADAEVVPSLLERLRTIVCVDRVDLLGGDAR